MKFHAQRNVGKKKCWLLYNIWSQKKKRKIQKNRSMSLNSEWLNNLKYINNVTIIKTSAIKFVKNFNFLSWKCLNNCTEYIKWHMNSWIPITNFNMLPSLVHSHSHILHPLKHIFWSKIFIPYQCMLKFFSKCAFKVRTFKTLSHLKLI